VDAIPISARAAATDGQYSVVIFYGAELEVIFVVFHDAAIYP
jgi:hypothetical protein